MKIAGTNIVYHPLYIVLYSLISSVVQTTKHEPTLVTEVKVAIRKNDLAVDSEGVTYFHIVSTGRPRCPFRGEPSREHDAMQSLIVICNDSNATFARVLALIQRRADSYVRSSRLPVWTTAAA
jgi:hypothetical protein